MRGHINFVTSISTGYYMLSKGVPYLLPEGESSKSGTPDEEGV